MTPATSGAALALARGQALLASVVPGGEVTSVSPGIRMVSTTVPLTIMNGVVVTSAEHDPTDLDRALAEVAGRMQAWTMQVVGHNPTEAEVAVAANHGLSAMRFPTMTRPLGGPGGPVDVSAARPDVEVRTVSTPHERAGFARALGTAFGTGARLGEPFVAESVTEHPRMTAYVVPVDGQVAATGFTTLDEDGWLGVFAIGTVPQLRRRGLSRALTLRMLADGERSGAHTAYLQASDMGRPLYEELGFTDSGDDTVYFHD